MNRALIDWDFESHGIWLINLPRESPTPPREVNRRDQLSPWSELLTAPLMDRLHRWNEWGCLLGGPASDGQGDDRAWEALYREGEDLAQVTQIELGDHWQVLWAANGAWHFVRYP
jgi:hypothetical protein